VTAPDDLAGDPPVAVVMPVLNEGAHLAAAVGSVLDQDYPVACQVVLALGPSKDRTDEVAAALAARHPEVTLVRNPSGRTPTGLNAALAATDRPVVVRVDAHSVLPPGYVSEAVRTLQRTGADNVGGIMGAEGTTDFERAVAYAMTSRFGVGGARFHTGGDEGPAETVYLGAFRRATLVRVGGYDEQFVRAQDWELNHRIREAGGLVWFDPALYVTYRPRPDLSRLARQYADFGRWRRVVSRTHAGTINARYLAAPATFVGIAVGLALGLLALLLWSPWPALGLLLPAVYVAAVVAAALTARGQSARVRALLLVVFPTMHLCWGWGFLTSRRRLVPAPRGGGQQL
jgi:glycosyltransferase involved in cell wall biosynthesis